MGILTSPQLSAAMLEFTLVDERVTLRLRARGKTVSVMNTMFMDAHKCMWYQTLGRRSMIDFVIVSSDLRPCVLDTPMKRGGRAVS